MSGAPNGVAFLVIDESGGKRFSWTKQEIVHSENYINLILKNIQYMVFYRNFSYGLLQVILFKVSFMLPIPFKNILNEIRNFNSISNKPAIIFPFSTVTSNYQQLKCPFRKVFFILSDTLQCSTD